MRYAKWIAWVKKAKAHALVCEETHTRSTDGAWEHMIVVKGESGFTKVVYRYWPRDESAGADLESDTAPLAFRVGDLINRVQCWRRMNEEAPWEQISAQNIGGGLEE